MQKLNQETLDKVVTQTVRNTNIHGAVIYIESVDKTLSLVSASGNFTVENQYYIASINKLLISFITLRLCQDKQLKLSDKISRYLSKDIMNGLLVHKGKDYSSEITINHLISHTSGFPDYLIDRRPDGKKNMDLILSGEDQSWPLDKVISEVKKMKPKFQPGSNGKANYSEVNFRLLANILEIVTQTNIRELLTSLMAELEMEDSFVLPSKSAINCVPIYFKNNTIIVKEYWKSTNYDISSTTKDQMKLIRAFFEGKYITGETLSTLKKWNDIFFPFKYGIGIQKFYVPRILSPFKAIPEMLGHSGSVGSVAFYIPEKRMYITGTINQTSNPGHIFKTMIKIINKL